MLRPTATAMAVLALAVAPSATAATTLRADVDGDGARDTVSLAHGVLSVTTAGRRTSVRVRSDDGSPMRLEGALRVHGLKGMLVFVRVRRSLAAFVDAPYQLRRGRLRRLHVPNGQVDGFAIGGSGDMYLDYDCGAAAGTVVQISGRPRGDRYRTTYATFTLRRNAFRLTGIVRRSVTVQQASHRRCAIVRR